MSEQITRASNYARELYYMQFVCTNTHSHASYIAPARKFARELFDAIATRTHYIIKRVNLHIIAIAMSGILFAHGSQHKRSPRS